jgi:hypothetical protein
MQPQKLSEEQIQNSVTAAVEEAVSFIEDEIAPDRIKAQQYVDGRSAVTWEEGRSKVVATKCRDTLRAIKPVLMRVFLQSDKPVEFIPRSQQAVAGAEQATSYAQVIFERNGGFQALDDVFHDALVKKVGIIKAYFDETETVEIDEYSNLSQEQVQFLLSDPLIEVLEQEEVPGDGDPQPVMGPNGMPQVGPDGMPVMAGPPSTFKLKIAKTDKNGEIKFQSIAPEDFFVDRSAVSIDDCYVCGHSSERRVGDLVQMGFDFQKVYELGGISAGGTDEEEEIARTGWDDVDDDEKAIDPSMRRVLMTEAYMRMDIEGTGVPRMYKFICAGKNYTILDYELCDHVPFAVFEVDPEPHTFFGRSLVEIIQEDQDAATSLLRGLLDSINMSNNPRVAAVESQVNMDDLLNNEVGGVIRVKAPGQLQEFSIGNAASAALPAMQFYDEAIRGKTGVTGAAMGMDADALQSQTAAGVNAAVQAQSAVAELIARHLAEGGMKRLFKLIAELARQHPQADEMMQLNGQFVPVDPRSWAASLDVRANVGLGTGKHEERMMILGQTLQTQQMILTQMGPNNGLVSLTNVRAVLADILKLAGIHNADRYYMPMSPEIEQQMMQAAQQASQNAPQDPNMALIQVEQMKAQAKAQNDQAKLQIESQKAQAEYQLKGQQAAAQDDLARDKMAQDRAFRAAELLAKHRLQVDQNAIRQEQMMPRQG